MQIILVPGLWLNGSTWNDVVPLLEAAGHHPLALTLPGMESKDADRAGITLADHVSSVVAALDAADEPVLLVGHSAGCGIAHAALDARPGKVAGILHVGGFPAAEGESLLASLAGDGDDVPMPDWVEMGEAANVVDFDPARLEAFYAAAIPVPTRVLTDPVHLGDAARHDVPATMVCPEYTAAQLREWVDSGDLPEITANRHTTYVDLPGAGDTCGHWPQLTQPAALAGVIVSAAH
ncbi:MAG TPA: alpha/beta hydrolase [Nocardioides sp.]